MIINNARNLIGFLLIPLMLSVHTVAHAENQLQPTVVLENQLKDFPSQLKVLIELLGKKDFIEIPMQESFAAKEFVNDNNYANRIQNSLITISLPQNGIVKAKLKTTESRLNLYIEDNKNNYSYIYNFGNGYIFSTTVAIPVIATGGYDSSLKIQYIYNKIDKYLIDQGYKNTTLILRKMLTGISTYEKGNILIETDAIGFGSVYYTITATNKDIDKNIESVIVDTTKKDIALKYQSLENKTTKRG